VPLGIVEPKLAECQTAAVDWMSAMNDATIEDGESQEATETLNNALSVAAKYYVDAKEVLLAIIYTIEKPDEIIEEYGITGDTPRDFKGLSERLSIWLETDAKLNALVPPDPRVVPPAIVANLSIQLDTIKTLWHDSQTESREKSQGYATKKTLYATHSKLFSFVYTIAKITWGDDDPRLRDLGLCPSSEIWTHNSPHAPKNLAFDIESGIFSWDAVDDVDSYQLDCRLTGKTGAWTNIYEGAEISTAIKPPSPDEYDIRCRAIAGDTQGNWCTPITVDFTA
jgi:hypothetical protein